MESLVCIGLFEESWITKTLRCECKKFLEKSTCIDSHLRLVLEVKKLNPKQAPRVLTVLDNRKGIFKHMLPPYVNCLNQVFARDLPFIFVNFSDQKIESLHDFSTHFESVDARTLLQEIGTQKWFDVINLCNVLGERPVDSPEVRRQDPVAFASLVKLLQNELQVIAELPRE